MAYDEHSNDGPPGPIASQAWWANSVATALRQIPPGKAIVTIGNYAYDWHDGAGDPDDVEEAWVDAADSEATPVFDRAAGNSTFGYEDEDGHSHTVWLLDAASAFKSAPVRMSGAHPFKAVDIRCARGAKCPEWGGQPWARTVTSTSPTRRDRQLCSRR